MCVYVTDDDVSDTTSTLTGSDGGQSTPRQLEKTSADAAEEQVDVEGAVEEADGKQSQPIPTARHKAAKLLSRYLEKHGAPPAASRDPILDQSQSSSAKQSDVNTEPVDFPILPPKQASGAPASTQPTSSTPHEIFDDHFDDLCFGDGNELCASRESLEWDEVTFSGSDDKTAAEYQQHSLLQVPVQVHVRASSDDTDSLSVITERTEPDSDQDATLTLPVPSLPHALLQPDAPLERMASSDTLIDAGASGSDDVIDDDDDLTELIESNRKFSIYTELDTKRMLAANRTGSVDVTTDLDLSAFVAANTLHSDVHTTTVKPGSDVMSVAKEEIEVKQTRRSKSNESMTSRASDVINSSECATPSPASTRSSLDEGYDTLRKSATKAVRVRNNDADVVTSSKQNTAVEDKSPGSFASLQEFFLLKTSPNLPRVVDVTDRTHQPETQSNVHRKEPEQKMVYRRVRAVSSSDDDSDGNDDGNDDVTNVEKISLSTGTIVYSFPTVLLACV